MAFQENVSLKIKAKRFVIQCVRVLKITKKPDRQEYKMLVKVSGLGIAAIGLMGFILFMIREMLLPPLQ
ncbi:protein translocase SEC61 complex subunit gamma [Candidatus Woesearchaeota archaeon]|nr:protein translocase SEC61 complex subunit gamma [Candidatus Woesearchaeota archaeon]